ncbi:hypothetical protein HJ590_07250 [Naumannella sp. ID2617S]|nr:hypothetical protein [Naumannella sp. ID2617S]
MAEAWAEAIADAPVDPLAAIQAMARLRAAAEACELDLVRAARNQGVSWSKIGAVYGLTKQGAQQRFRPRAASSDDGSE